MPTLSVKSAHTAPTIPLYCAPGIRNTLADYLRRQHPERPVYIISDTNIRTLYEPEIRALLAGVPGHVHYLDFPPGEASKSRDCKALLEDALLAHGAGRDALILALGGGVTGDVAGYVAACLHRGVGLIHMPTSLLAQVDSSIGGKVGINHPAGKNLLGAFYRPAAIFTDCDFLQSLPEVEFRNGLAEVIKYAVTLDSVLFDYLENNHSAILARNSAAVQYIVERSAQLKIGVVERDEHENDYRTVLNFGHTLGHAIEQAAGYTIRHGFAVAAGMRFAARLSVHLAGLSAGEQERINALLDRYGFSPATLGAYAVLDPDMLWPLMQRDKKARAAVPRFTLLGAIARPSLLHSVERGQLDRIGWYL